MGMHVYVKNMGMHVYVKSIGMDEAVTGTLTGAADLL